MITRVVRSPSLGQSHDKPVIVTIGASAGGVSALQNFFGSLPERPGAAFVVVVHLDPEHRSELASILSTRTRMPVIQVETREALRADHVYVIPPDRRLQLIDHQVCAEEFEEPRGHRAPDRPVFPLAGRTVSATALPSF